MCTVGELSTRVRSHRPTYSICVLSIPDMEECKALWVSGSKPTKSHAFVCTISGNYTLCESMVVFLPPVEGEDYLALEGTAAQLVWTADNPRVCTKIPLVDDQKVENDEYFFVTMDRIVTPSASPILDRRPLIVLIMDNDSTSLYI